MNTPTLSSNQSIVGIFLHWYKQLQSKQNQINQSNDSNPNGLTHSELIQTWDNTLFQHNISEASNYYHINIIQLIDIFLYQGYFKLIDQYYQLPTKYVDEMNFLFALNSAIKVLTSICQEPALKSVLSSISSEIQDQVNFYDRSFLPSNKPSEVPVGPNSAATITSATNSTTSTNSLPPNNLDYFKNNYEIGYEKPSSEFDDALSTNSEDSSFGVGSHPSLTNNQSLLTVSLPASEIEQSDPMIRFLALLRKGGIDILMPQSLHDQLLACVYLSIKLIYNSSFRDLIEILMKIKEINILPDLENVTKTKIRGVLALLKQSELMYTHVMENQSIRLIFAPMIHSFYDLRHFHDIYLQKFMAKNDLFIPSTIKQEIVWIAENEEIHKKKLEETEGYLHTVRDFINAKPNLLKKSRKNAKKQQQQQQQQQQQNAPLRAQPPLPPGIGTLGSKSMKGGSLDMIGNDYFSGLSNQHSLNDELLASDNSPSFSALNNNNSYLNSQFSINSDLLDDLPGSLPIPPPQQTRGNSQNLSLENNGISFSSFEKGQNRINNQMLNNINYNNGMNGNENQMNSMYHTGSNYKPNNFNQYPSNTNNNFPRNMNSNYSNYNNKNNYSNNYTNNNNKNYQSQNIDYPPSLYSNLNSNQDMFNHNTNFSSNNSNSKPPRTWNPNNNNNYTNNNRMQKYDSHPSFGSHHSEINNHGYDNNYNNSNKNSRNIHTSNHMNYTNPRPSLNSQFNPKHEFTNNHDFNRQESSYSYGQNKFPSHHNNNMNQDNYFSSSSLLNQNLNNKTSNHNNNIFSNKQTSFNQFGSNLLSSDSNSFPFETNTSNFTPNSFDPTVSLMESSSRNPRSDYESRSSSMNTQDFHGLIHDSYSSEKRMNFPSSLSEDKLPSNYFSTSPSSSMTTTQTMFTNTTF